MHYVRNCIHWCDSVYPLNNYTSPPLCIYTLNLVNWNIFEIIFRPQQKRLCKQSNFIYAMPTMVNIFWFSAIKLPSDCLDDIIVNYSGVLNTTKYYIRKVPPPVLFLNCVGEHSDRNIKHKQNKWQHESWWRQNHILNRKIIYSYTEGLLCRFCRLAGASTLHGFFIKMCSHQCSI